MKAHNDTPWYDELIAKGMYCKGCDKTPVSRMVCNVIVILLNLWCIGACSGHLLLTVLQFLTAGNLLILVRQLIIYHRRGDT